MDNLWCPGSGTLPSDWSPSKRRGTCPTCGRTRVAIKRDGTLYAHMRPSDA